LQGLGHGREPAFACKFDERTKLAEAEFFKVAAWGGHNGFRLGLKQFRKFWRMVTKIMSHRSVLFDHESPPLLQHSSHHHAS
jgi:hypothetical protein